MIPNKKNNTVIEPIYTPIHTPDDMSRIVGRSHYPFTFKEIKDNKLILNLSNNFYSVLVPPHWIDAELLEPGCSVEISSLDKSVIPSIRDSKGFIAMEGNSKDRFLFIWRARTWLFVQNHPEQYYTVYQTLSDINYTGYDSIGGFCIKKMPHPYKIAGYAPLLNKEQFQNSQIRGFPFMCKKGKK